MVRYRNAGTQVFEDTEHESVDTDKLRTDQGVIWETAANDALQETCAFTVVEQADTITTTNYVPVAKLSGFIDISQVPDAATLFGRMAFRSGSVVDQDSSVQPQLLTVPDNGGVDLSELETTVAAGDTGSMYDTGWVEISSITSNAAIGIRLRAKLETQTNGDSFEAFPETMWGLDFKWRLD